MLGITKSPLKTYNFVLAEFLLNVNRTDGHCTRNKPTQVRRIGDSVYFASKFLLVKDSSKK